MAGRDLTGQTFGYWTVLEDSGERTKDRNIKWKCQCACGTIRNVDGSSLTKGRSKSCGCLKKIKVSERMSADLFGQTFGRLAVKEKLGSRDGQIYWLCQCECGNTCERSTRSLKKDGIHSCGCYTKEQAAQLMKKNLLNQKFGKLTVLEETSDRKWGGVVWKCQCDCGNIAYVNTNSLTTGNTASCGCLNGSIGENNISTILDKANISYCKQYSTPGLKLKRFDFALLQNNCPIRLIEFDGRQHFDDISGIWNSPESLIDIQRRDQEKNQWAHEQNIPLVRIPYWERDNITLDMILGDQYLVKPE